MMMSKNVPPQDPSLLPEGESVIVSVTGEGVGRRASLRPSSLERATGEQSGALEALQTLALERRELEMMLSAHVEQARDLGISWGLVGWSIGLTAEGARQKYDPELIEARSRGRRRRR